MSFREMLIMLLLSSGHSQKTIYIIINIMKKKMVSVTQIVLMVLSQNLMNVAYFFINECGVVHIDPNHQKCQMMHSIH